MHLNGLNEVVGMATICLLLIKTLSVLIRNLSAFNKRLLEFQGGIRERKLPSPSSRNNFLVPLKPQDRL